VVDDRSIKANDSTRLQTFILAQQTSEYLWVVRGRGGVELVEFFARGACSSGMQESLARARGEIAYSH
jgi:hypothetical protein